MIDLAIWATRMFAVFAGCATFIFSKRLSLVIFVSAFLDFFVPVVFVATGPALLFHASWLFLLGFLIGWPITIGVHRLYLGDACKTSLAIFVLLKLPVCFSCIGLHELITTCAVGLVMVLAFPLGLLAGAEVVHVWRNLR